MLTNTIGIPESHARRIMQHHKVERGMEDPRSCAEIVQDLGLVSVNNEIEIINVDEEQRLNQAYNLIANVQAVRAPYFVR